LLQFARGDADRTTSYSHLTEQCLIDARPVLEHGFGLVVHHGCLALGLQTEQLLQLHTEISHISHQGIGQMGPAVPIFDDFLLLLLLQLLVVLSLCSLEVSSQRVAIRSSSLRRLEPT